MRAPCHHGSSCDSASARSVRFASSLLLAGAADAAELVMFRRDGCPWCARWDREIGPIYPKTDLEPAARRCAWSNLDRGDDPRCPHLQSPIRYTPTFVLVEDGQEVGRIEGYPGDDFLLGPARAPAGAAAGAKPRGRRRERLIDRASVTMTGARGARAMRATAAATANRDAPRRRGQACGGLDLDMLLSNAHEGERIPQSAVARGAAADPVLSDRRREVGERDREDAQAAAAGGVAAAGAACAPTAWSRRGATARTSTIRWPAPRCAIVIQVAARRLLPARAEDAS